MKLGEIVLPFLILNVNNHNWSNNALTASGLAKPRISHRHFTSNAQQFTHINSKNQPTMVDVGEKTVRTPTASFTAGLT